ncbi:MAG: Tm-1-like ATP-binding domain-containing protein, partial [Planctomycetaceae bacterium]
MSSAVYAVATMDTKDEELCFVAQCLRDAGVDVRTVDVGTTPGASIAADVSRDVVLDGKVLPPGDDRGVAVTAMGEALTAYLRNENDQARIAGVIGIGGSGGTALITAAMRELPIGLPKLMVSTVASGNTAPYVDCSDLTMMYSVVDVAGLNVVSEQVLANAAHAMAGMVSHKTPSTTARTCLGMTMFGVTTPCVTAVRESLESKGYDCLVFHATGAGGRAMEQLVRSGLIRGVLDITTTEVADEIVGGVFPAGPRRFDCLVESYIPLVLSVGALDMVNFGAIDTVPKQFRDRNLYVHNAQVTLMR